MYHKAEYMPTIDERRLIDRYSLLMPCNCSIGHDHQITPYKREGLGAGQKMWFRNQTEPYVFPSTLINDKEK